MHLGRADYCLFRGTPCAFSVLSTPCFGVSSGDKHSAGMLMSAPPLVGSLPPHLQLVSRKNICRSLKVCLKFYGE